MHASATLLACLGCSQMCPSHAEGLGGCVLNTICMQSHAMHAENATLRSQIQEHQAHSAALQDQSAEQNRTIRLGSLQLKQLQSKVRPICTCDLPSTKPPTYTASACVSYVHMGLVCMLQWLLYCFPQTKGLPAIIYASFSLQELTWFTACCLPIKLYFSYFIK